MATFKVGQRVRIIYQGPRSSTKYGCVIGHTGTITAIPAEDPNNVAADCGIRVDDFPPDPLWGSYGIKFYQLAPLLDPDADEFIADIERGVKKPTEVLQ